MKRLITKKASNGNELLIGLDKIINNSTFRQYILNRVSEFAREEFEHDYENTTESDVLDNYYDELNETIDDIIEYFIDDLVETLENSSDDENGDIFYNTSSDVKELAVEKIFETLHSEIVNAIDNEKEDMDDMYNNR